jgi:hypothetical protein
MFAARSMSSSGTSWSAAPIARAPGRLAHDVEAADARDQMGAGSVVRIRTVVDLPRACHNVTLDTARRSLVTLTPLTDLNVTAVSAAKTAVTLTPLTVVNVTRGLL